MGFVLFFLGQINQFDSHALLLFFSYAIKKRVENKVILLKAANIFMRKRGTQ